MSAEAVLKAFDEQAEACAMLGSPFMGALCRLIHENLSGDTEIGAHCLNWSGDPSSSADNVPLRLCGGLHALVTTGLAPDLQDSYPRSDGSAPDWEQIEKAFIEHADFLIAWMKSPPQTNEVSRSAVIWPALMMLSKMTQKPLRLLELGASGGLNLNANHYSYDYAGIVSGEKDSPLVLKPEWKGVACEVFPVEVHSKAGCDLNPLDVRSEDDRLRLRSYVWPDQQDRIDRLNAALEVFETHPVQVDRADAIDWLEAQLADFPEDCCTVIYSTIAWQYFPQEAKDAGEAIILEAASKAKVQNPLAWLQFEADSKAPGGNIGLRFWPNTTNVSLGRADFHGRWVDWNGL